MAKRRPRGAGNLVLRGQTWYMRVIENGRRVEISTGKKERAAAERELMIKLGELARGNRIREDTRRATVADALNLVLSDYKERGRASLKDARTRADLHLRPKLGSVLLMNLTSKNIMAYAKARLAERKKPEPATVNRELAMLRRGLRLALEQEPPWITRVPKVQMLAEDNVRQGWIEHDQYEKLRDALPAHLQLPFVIGYHTGLRKGTILSLRLDQVDWAARVIRLERLQVKNRRAHLVPIYGDMDRYLETVRESNDRYLCELKGEPVTISPAAWRAAVQSVGLPGLLFHDLRRSAVRNMIQAGVPESVAMKISGHRTHSMLQRYNVVVERDVKAAAVRVQQYLTAPARSGETSGEARTTENDSSEKGGAR